MENRVSEEIAERRALPSDPRPLSLGSGGVPVCRGNLSFLKAPRLAGRGSATGRDLPQRTDCPGQRCTCRLGSMPADVQPV